MATPTGQILDHEAERLLTCGRAISLTDRPAAEEKPARLLASRLLPKTKLSWHVNTKSDFRPVPERGSAKRGRHTPVTLKEEPREHTYQGANHVPTHASVSLTHHATTAMSPSPSPPP